jgi:GTPase SAR1 family protein
MTRTDRQYEIFQEKRQALASLIQRQLRILHSLNMAGAEDSIRKLEERVLNDNFKVLVLGEFKRGKSTFINALLKQEVLPAYSTPTTAIINEVKWGQPIRAVLHYKDTKKQPQEIPVDKIEEYVTIQNFSNSEKEVRESPYEKLELFWSLDLCRNGVEIIDSPGLNENAVRQQVTVDYLSRVDAILFVLSCLQLGPSESEANVIELVRNCGHKDIFFICNWFNDVRPDKEKERVKRHGLSQFSSQTNLGENGIFFITASEALEGYQNGNQDQIERSRIGTVEQALATFLSREKGRIKIVRSETVLRDSINRAKDVIPDREKMLKTDLQTLENRYANAQETLNKLERDRQSIVRRIVEFREDIKDLVRAKAREFFDTVAGKTDAWVGEYEVQQPIKLLSSDVFKMEEAARRVVDEVTKHLSKKVDSELSAWQRQTLQPFLESRLDGLKDDLDEKARNFVAQVDQARLQIVQGVSVSEVDVEVQGTKVSPLERILAGVGGFVMMDYGSAAIGGLFGFQEMLKSLIPQIATIVLTTAIAGLNPWILIPAIFASSSVQALIKVNAITDKIKQAVGKEYTTKIRTSSQIDGIANAVSNKLTGIQTTVDQGLGNEIQSVRSQVESVLAEKRKSQGNVDQKIKELHSLLQELNTIGQELNKLMRQVAQM